MKEMVKWGHELALKEFKLKVAEMIQQRNAPFIHRIPGASRLKLCKNRHP
jgi:hypothetical protein